MRTEERRLHARILLDLPCALVGSRLRLDGRIRDLSTGGASVSAHAGSVRVQDAFIVAIDVPGLPALSIPGKVVRLEERGAEGRYGIRFSDLDPRQREELRLLLDALLQTKGIGTRRHVRLSYCAEVTCRSQKQFCAVMRNICKGGMALACDERLEVGETIAVEIRTSRRALVIPGRVVHIQSAPDTVKVGVRFDPLPPDIQDALEGFLRQTLRAPMK